VIGISVGQKRVVGSVGRVVDGWMKTVLWPRQFAVTVGNSVREIILAE
jgi:hypothetical protein